jgi:hypothetical protein
MRSPFKYFNSSTEVIRLAVMMYVRYPLSLRNVEDLLSERGIDICQVHPQPFQPGAPPYQPRDLQTKPLSRSG